MAEEQVAAVAATAPPAASNRRWFLIFLVGMLSAVAGFAVPQFVGRQAAPAPDDAARAAKATKYDVETGVMTVSFGEVVANLDDARMMRYVRARFSLSVDKRDGPFVQQVVDSNKTVLKNWLIGYLQNKQIEEVRGTEGFNRIRREIQERFNQMLFPPEEPKIKEVLFDEFNVQ